MTYCSTVPSLAALEKRVHVTDPALLPPQAMVEYELPDDVPARTIVRGSPARPWRDVPEAQWLENQGWTDA